MFNLMRFWDRARAVVDRMRGVGNRLPLHGKFFVEHYDANGVLKGKYEVPNGITDEGIHYLENTGFRAVAQITTWYIGIIDNASFTAVADADTMASHAGWIESTAYTNSPDNRATWSPGAAASRQITNGTTADFSINATVTLKGIFITSVNTKGGTTGTLWSTALFGSNVNVVNGDTLKITYTLAG